MYSRLQNIKYFPRWIKQGLFEVERIKTIENYNSQLFSKIIYRGLNEKGCALIFCEKIYGTTFYELVENGKLSSFQLSKLYEIQSIFNEKNLLHGDLNSFNLIWGNNNWVTVDPALKLKTWRGTKNFSSIKRKLGVKPILSTADDKYSFKIFFQIINSNHIKIVG